MFKTVNHLLSLIRFSHTIFALPFALLAMLMAGFLNATGTDAGNFLGHIEVGGFGKPVTYTTSGLSVVSLPDALFSSDLIIGQYPGESIPSGSITTLLNSISLANLLGILLCMVTARSAAMAFNRLVDRKIDAENPRTEGRHLPAGILSAGQVTLFTVLSSVGFIASTLLFLPNKLPLYLSVPVLLWLCGYSYAKRFTSLAHYWLGAALGMSPIAAWIAIRGDAVMQNPTDLLPAVVLAGAVMAWVGGFDILYACQDYEYDRGAKLHSIPTWLGVPGALRLAAASHVLTVLLLIVLPLVYPPFGMVYWLGVALIAGLLIYEHSLVKADNLERVNLAFFNVNAIISIGLLLIGVVDLII